MLKISWFRRNNNKKRSATILVKAEKPTFVDSFACNLALKIGVDNTYKTLYSLS